MTAVPHEVLDRLDDTNRARLLAYGEPANYRAGIEIFREGEHASGCWLICRGDIALRTEVPGRGLVTVQTIGAGDVLGLSWLVAPHRWAFTATTATDVEALRLDTERLRADADRDPAFGYLFTLALFEILLSRLHNTRARLLDVYRSPRAR